MTSVVAVETSDLVNSTKMEHEQLKSTLNLIKSTHHDLLGESRFAEYYRGDAFQILYVEADQALKRALLLKLKLAFGLSTPVQITQSIYLGDVSNISQFEDKSISINMEAPFIESGRQLDCMQKGELCISASFLSAEFTLANAFFNRVVKALSKKQCEVLYWYILLGFPEQKAVAEKLNMTRQNVNTHLIRSHSDLIKQFLFHYSANVAAHSKVSH